MLSEASEVQNLLLERRELVHGKRLPPVHHLWLARGHSASRAGIAPTPLPLTEPWACPSGQMWEAGWAASEFPAEEAKDPAFGVCLY